jgi:hypothetical protein
MLDEARFEVRASEARLLTADRTRVATSVR